jgi:CrcB protein
MTRALLVGAGGFLGSMARYLLSGAVQSWSNSVSFPWGTFAVNVLGCLAIGVLAHLAEFRGAFSEATRLFLFAGILGGFTTFSAFGNETLILGRSGAWGAAAANVVMQVVLGIGAVWAGRAAAFAIWR